MNFGLYLADNLGQSDPPHLIALLLPIRSTTSALMNSKKPNRQKFNPLVLGGISLALLSPSLSAEAKEVPPATHGEIYQRGYLGKEKSMQSIQMQDGYSLELVLSDPDVKEPVALTWDGNGVLYVVEMRTYMQDADATGEKEPVSRISRHEDLDGDGIYEKHTVFADNLMLPRFALPLDDRILVGLTDTKDLWTFRDTDGDGVADEKIKVYEGGPRGGNMEHQASAMLWNLDNWMYCTYEPYRFRFTEGKIEVEPLPKGQGQWGLAMDNVGRLYYSRAGGEQPAAGIQQPPIYGVLNLPKPLQQSADFHAVYPIADVPDAQGGLRRLNPRGGLNQFTGGGGQSIYRGDRLPADLQGSLILNEPVGRLVRRADVTRENGITHLSNHYQEDEFMRARDINFRPLWSATSPDGAIMVIDIHRGIIQQGNWTRPDSYLRGIIDKWGLDKNIGKGRIYRIEHSTYQPDQKPRMLDESTSELVAHLSHPNGWWRDTAQKLILLRENRNEVVPALEELLTSGDTELGRLHALWTLEGLSQVKPDMLKIALNDTSSIVRTAAVRISEPFLEQNHSEVMAAVLENQYLGEDIEMQIQYANSIVYSGAKDEALLAYADELKERNKEHPVFLALDDLHRQVAKAQEDAKVMRAYNKELAVAMSNGKVTYEQLCFACHGPDGKGAPMSGAVGQFLAPSFANNKRLMASDQAAVRTLLHGLTGDLDGKEYEGLMVAMGTNSDEWIADVVTYIRNSFGNRSGVTKASTVKALREMHQDRTEPWTQKELEALSPKNMERKDWKLTASDGASTLESAIDGKMKTRYTTGVAQKKGMWVQIELPKMASLSGLKLNYGPSQSDGPQFYEVRLSKDGNNWSEPVASGKAFPKNLSLSFAPTDARFVKIEITSANTKLFWSIHEMQIRGTELGE